MEETVNVPLSHEDVENIIQSLVLNLERQVNIHRLPRVVWYGSVLLICGFSLQFFNVPQETKTLGSLVGLFGCVIYAILLMIDRCYSRRINAQDFPIYELLARMYEASAFFDVPEDAANRNRLPALEQDQRQPLQNIPASNLV